MDSLKTTKPLVSCAAFQTVTWLNWPLCPYNDALAIFRFILPDGQPAPYQQTWLNADEISRAHRYHREVDRNRFLYTRSILRVLLGNYMNLHPNEIFFTTSINKKPVIKNNTNWHINISHSGDWILIAISKTDVGVDVEKVIPDFAFQDMLSSSFSQEECQHIEASANSRLLFYELWVRKEALVKATAKGLDDDFAQIPSVDGVHQLEGDLLGATGNWTVRSFHVVDAYPAAVAYKTMSELPTFYTLNNDLFSRYEP